MESGILIDFSEAVLSVGAAVLIWVEFLCQLVVGFLDLGLRRVLPHAQYLWTIKNSVTIEILLRLG